MEKHELVQVIEETKNASQLFLTKLADIRALVKFDIIKLPTRLEDENLKDVFLSAFDETKAQVCALVLGILTLPSVVDNGNENRGEE